MNKCGAIELPPFTETVRDSWKPSYDFVKPSYAAALNIFKGQNGSKFISDNFILPFYDVNLLYQELNTVGLELVSRERRARVLTDAII